MYEFTHAGLWLKWNALDRRSKWLAGLSLASSGAASIPLAIVAGVAAYDWGYRLGHRLAGGHDAPPAAAQSTAIALAPSLAWLTVALGIVSALLWWRFSLRQDEMFNRVQNWALGMGGAWTCAILTCWSVLALVGAAPPVTPLSIIILVWAGLVGFWLAAVRRWA